MKNKALIVTTQRHFNFGTMLQCHALQHFIESQGWRVEVLDYLGTEYKLSNLKSLRIWFGDFRRHPLKYIRIILNSVRNIRRTSLYRDFLKNYINLTAESYKTFDDINNCIPLYNIYIAGSDQVWNPRLGGFKPVYFLKFAPSNAKKISYAASFGIDTFSTKESEAINTMVSDFDSVSCREITGINFLTQSGIDSVLAIDPTMLLPVEYWRTLEDTSICGSRRNYILTYFLSPDKNKSSMLHHSYCSRQSILNLSTEKDAVKADILAAGPRQFLGLIDNCDLLITDSFHGIVFSILFHKNFYVVPRNENDANSQNTRIINLLEHLGLQERWLPDFNLPDQLEDIDYPSIESKLYSLILSSKLWLQNALIL